MEHPGKVTNGTITMSCIILEFKDINSRSCTQLHQSTVYIETLLLGNASIKKSFKVWSLIILGGEGRVWLVRKTKVKIRN